MVYALSHGLWRIACLAYVSDRANRTCGNDEEFSFDNMTYKIYKIGERIRSHGPQAKGHRLLAQVNAFQSQTRSVINRPDWGQWARATESTDRSSTHMWARQHTLLGSLGGSQKKGAQRLTISGRCSPLLPPLSYRPHAML